MHTSPSATQMDRYLIGIKESRREVLLEIYNNNFPPIKNFVMQNTGDLDDAKDVFQDVMVSLFRKLSKEDIILKSSFNVYIFTIGKYVWFKHLKKKMKTSEISETTPYLDEELREEEKFKLFQNALGQLGEDCQKVLSYYFEKKTFDEIADLMSYKSGDYAKRKKYLCKNQLVSIVKEDPEFNNLY